MSSQTLHPVAPFYTLARDFDEQDLSYEQWRSVLHLSSRWGFASIRKLALKSINPPNACEQLALARDYGVDHWVLPALSALCKRRLPISLEEARQMSIEDVVLVATVREEIRDNGLPVDTVTAKIPWRVQVAQARMLGHVASNDVSPVKSEKDAAEKEQAVANSSTEADRYDGTGKATVANPPETPEKVDGHGSHEHLVSQCVIWSVNSAESLMRHRDTRWRPLRDHRKRKSIRHIMINHRHQRPHQRTS